MATNSSAAHSKTTTNMRQEGPPGKTKDGEKRDGHADRGGKKTFHRSNPRVSESALNGVLKAGGGQVVAQTLGGIEAALALCAAGGDAARRLEAAEASLASLESENRLEQVSRRKSGQRVGVTTDLGVGDLPEQEVRDPHLTRRSDQQVGIGLAGGVEGAGDRRLVDVDPPWPAAESATILRQASTISQRPE